MNDLPVRRAGAQWLTRRPGADVAAVAGHLVGLQAQDTAAARLGVRARSATTTAAQVRQAGRSVARTWLMRGTLHLVPVEDVRWLLALFGPRNAAGGVRRRRELGLDEATCARALTEIPAVLGEHSPLSRADLIAALIRRGVSVDPRGQAPAHLVGYAAAHGLICRGPDLAGDEPGYVLLDEWLPEKTPMLDGDAALAELTRRYLGAYGPATYQDLAAWSGLPASKAKHGFHLLADDLVEVDGNFAVPGQESRETGQETQETGQESRETGPVLRLVGAFDTYLLGYRSRDAILDPLHARRIQAGGGIIHPAILLDGRVIGAWRLRGRNLVPQPFEPLDPDLTPQLENEAADLGRFFGAEIALSESTVAPG
jgi:hypothetical protein